MDNSNLELCPHFDFRPEDDHGFTLIPLEAILECPKDCIAFASFLVNEATGHPHLSPPSTQVLDWVRTVMQLYAHLFVRALTSIPAELIPPASHISNIDRKIEGRPVSVDLKRNEVVFKIDNTSVRKLEVFYTELTGKEPTGGLTEQLDELRIRMTMAVVIGYELLTFKGVVGELFNIGDQNTCIFPEQFEGRNPAILNQWGSFQALLEHRDRKFSPTQYEADHDDWGSLQVAVGEYSDDDQLETFPEDGSASPQAYWDLTNVARPRTCIQNGLKELERRTTAVLSTLESSIESHSPSEHSFNTSKAFIRGAPKAYSGLGYKNPAKILRQPPTPSLVSRVDPPSPTVLTLSDSIPLAPSFEDKSLAQQTSNSPTTWDTSGPIIGTQSISKDLTQGCFSQSSTPPALSRSSSADLGSEATTPSATSTNSHPSIYDAFPTSPVASEHAVPNSQSTIISEGGSYEQWDGMQKKKKTNSWTLPGTAAKVELEESNENGFFSEVEHERLPPITRTEKKHDQAKIIIQEKMEAMLDAAESEGYICKATRDGLDNHPISVRLRSISGNHPRMKTSSRSRSSSATTNDGTLSTGSPMDTVGFFFEKSDTDSQSSKGKHMHNKSTPTHVLQAGGYGHPNDQNFSEYKTTMKSTADHLKALKLRFEQEGEQILESYYRTLKRIQVLEEQIQKAHSRELISLRNKTREMIEYCGYDESAFTQESDDREVAAHFDAMNPIFFELKPIKYEVEATLGKGKFVHLKEGYGGIQPKTDSKEPLKVRTKFYENHIESKEISPCCQYAATTKGDLLDDSGIRCAHGIVQIVKPHSNSNNPVSPMGNTDSWKLNYTIGGQRGRAVKHYRGGIGDKMNGQSGGYRNPPPQPPRRSFSGTDTPKPVKQFPTASEQCPHTTNLLNYDNLALQQPVGNHETVSNNYFEKLAEYYRTTRGEATNACGTHAPTCATNISIAKENFGTGF